MLCPHHSLDCVKGQVYCLECVAVRVFGRCTGHPLYIDSFGRPSEWVYHLCYLTQFAKRNTSKPFKATEATKITKTLRLVTQKGTSS